MTTIDTPKAHVGRNIKRLREMMGIKQEVLAAELGGDWTQSKISTLEQKETIEQEILEQVAKVLKVTPEAIQNFSEGTVTQVINNTFNDNETINSVANATNCSFNPIDKVVELFERLLASEKEKVELLRQELERSKKSK